MHRNTRDELVTLVNSTIERDGYECIDVVWSGKDRALAIYIDHQDGVTIEDCVAVTRVLNELEVFETVIPGAYQLEVSTPGVDRPLRTKAHFEKVLGEAVKLSLLEPVDGFKKGTAILKAVTPDDSLIMLKDAVELCIPIQFLNSANLVYDWS